MRYLGGKARIGKTIAEIINQHKMQYTHYWEPFCGSCDVIRHVEIKNRIASDLHPDLILLWKALQEGWAPPESISEEEYERLKKAPPSPLRGFVGFGASFAGKWFAGYARDKTTRNYALNAKNSLAKKIIQLQDVEFLQQSYRNYLPKYPSVIYCDPPYMDTTGYGSVEGFNSEQFWDWVRKVSTQHLVLVSEYQAPEDFECIWARSVKTDIRGGKENKQLNRVERLFRWKGNK